MREVRIGDRIRSQASGKTGELTNRVDSRFEVTWDNGDKEIIQSKHYLLPSDGTDYELIED